MRVRAGFLEGVELSQFAAAVIGPAIFFITWRTFPAFACLVIMFWLATYWAMGVMPILYTALIPVIGFGLMGVDAVTIVSSFWHPALMLIVGPTVVIEIGRAHV